MKRHLALAALFASCAAPSAAHVSAPSHRPLAADWRDFPTVPRTTTTARASRSAGVERREAGSAIPAARTAGLVPTPSSSTSAPPARTDGGEPATPPRVAPPVSTQHGAASWYKFKPSTCAHRSLPKGTVLTVTHAGRTARCTVADRGPYVAGRIIDLDASVFAQLAPLGSGVIEVEIAVAKENDQ